MTATETRCGRCGSPESAHEGATADETEILLNRLGCRGFAVSRAPSLTETHAPRPLLCHRCGRQGHDTESCPW